MAQVIKFPKLPSDKSSAQHSTATISTSAPFAYRRPSLPRRVRHGLRVALWVIVVLTWPIWRWFALIDLLIQSVRTLYFWHTPAIHPGLVLLMHVLTIAGLATFSLCEPKALE